ncbi:MAG: M20 family metallo-hydrolase, partial [Prevotella sp.]
MQTRIFTDEAVLLLKRLISTPSISREEKQATDILEDFILKNGMTCQREKNNVWIVSHPFDNSKPTILLNAHIDTVKPVSSWTKAPFEPIEEDGRIYGLGSNDCGGGLVALLQAFRILSSTPQPYNLIYLASAEEEISGTNGIAHVLPSLPEIDVAIVGEPTNMQPAVSEKGLMVIDLIARGKSGHAARGEGINAIYQALDDLVWLRSYKFERMSRFLGPTMMNVTMVNAGTQHNIIPDECKMVLDVRTNELYTNEEVFEIIRNHVSCDIQARSFRLHSSHINPQHPLIQRCIQMGMKPFGSPTLSDQALMPFPSFKLGP